MLYTFQNCHFTEKINLQTFVKAKQLCFNQNRHTMPFNNGQLTTQANWLIHNRHTMARHTMAFKKRSTDHTRQLAYPHQAHYDNQQKVN